MTNPDIVERIRKTLIREANASPLLMADLASMEQYIAESYKVRSLVELLQNADDAQGRRFVVELLDSVLIVGNDGRAFTEADVWAICRSGASQKRRGAETIGYRGIGFKSVVNLARRVHVLSGEVRMTFCRELTLRALAGNTTKVPLIRVPHPYTPAYGEKVERKLLDLTVDGYTTLFVFEGIDQRNVEAEIEEFDPTSLLFLRSIRQAHFKTGLSRFVTVNRRRDAMAELTELVSDQGKQQWVILRAREGVEACAFLLSEDGIVVQAPPEAAVVHAFTPTKEPVGMPFKVNGDFTTDPSRTRVDCDGATREACWRCAGIVTSLLRRVVTDETHKRCWHRICEIIDVTPDPLAPLRRFQFSHFFREILVGTLRTTEWVPCIDGAVVAPTAVRTRPAWLSTESYEAIVRNWEMQPSARSLEATYPGIDRLLSLCGGRPLDLHEVLQLLTRLTLPREGTVEVLAECVRRYRFGIPEDTRALLEQARLLECNDARFLSPCEFNNTSSQLSPRFLESLTMLGQDLADLRRLLNRLGLDRDKLETALGPSRTGAEDPYECPRNTEKADDGRTRDKTWEDLLERAKTPRSRDVLKRWRSAETNLAHMLRNLPDIEEVLDVSKSNLGYDLEIRRKDGRLEYVEVKSLAEMGQPISLTSNEYAVAITRREQYVLAPVTQDEDGLVVSFIRDPVAAVRFERRCTRWEWVAEEYPVQSERVPFIE